MKLLVTGATGYLGWRTTALLRERGHDVLALARPGHAVRSASRELDALQVDAGDPAARAYIAGCDAVLHFAGVPDPARAAADPARAIRENAGSKPPSERRSVARTTTFDEPAGIAFEPTKRSSSVSGSGSGQTYSASPSGSSMTAVE